MAFTDFTQSLAFIMLLALKETLKTIYKLHGVFKIQFENPSYQFLPVRRFLFLNPWLLVIFFYLYSIVTRKLIESCGLVGDPATFR